MAGTNVPAPECVVPITTFPTIPLLLKAQAQSAPVIDNWHIAAQYSRQSFAAGATMLHGRIGGAFKAQAAIKPAPSTVQQATHQQNPLTGAAGMLKAAQAAARQEAIHRSALTLYCKI